ncbi:protein MAIN-LIKE 1-like [Mercurialis annua]|uniref:protein MAIN-LIKE 1-like n=1 Tax=Mercurialis annua TaxID=3986 RepID=UPI00215FDDAD|nr:protein MAIN-LIKE 1-like [Mercurialis annua]
MSSKSKKSTPPKPTHHPYFKPGAMVEASSDDDGFRGSWYIGKIIRRATTKDPNKFLVEYETLFSDDGGKNPLKEIYDVAQLRPLAPRENHRKFRFGEKVDAYHSDGWWEGSITEEREDGRFAVYFKGSKEQIVFGSEVLRLHREWVDGEWKPPLEVEDGSRDRVLKEKETVKLKEVIKEKTKKVRAVSASVRRQQMQARAIERASGTPGGDHIQDDQIQDDQIEDADFQSSEDESLGPYVISRQRKGKDGRFVAESSSVTSKRGRTDEDVWAVSGPVPGGPEDGSVIPSFLGHVAFGIWTGKEERGTLKCQSRHAACKRLTTWYRGASDEVRGLIAGTGLGHLPETMFDHLDIPLLSAFVERWQPDTSSFHLPFGEMTITLHDVWFILGIPVDGKMISDEPGKQLLLASCVEILGITMDDLLADSTKHFANGGVLIESIFKICGQGLSAEVEAIAWIWLTLGCTLFVDKSGHRIRPACLWEMRDGATDATTYSWASATLAYLYRQLGIASRGDCHGLSGCLTLLQAWIYEYFPCFRPQRERLIIDPNTPRACSWSVSVTECTKSRLQSLRARIDQLTPDEVAWLPFGADPAVTVRRTAYMGLLVYRDIIEPYMSGRVVRQLGYMQTIPSPIFRPEKAVRSWNSLRYAVEMAKNVGIDGWDGFPMTCLLPLTFLDPATVFAGACHPAYMEWYIRFSHPQLLNIDVAAPRGRPSRSNTDYWVNRFSSVSQGILSRLSAMSAQYGIPEMEQTISKSTTDLERVMEDWRLAD